MSDAAPADGRTRALVLGGGGPVGVAWELGLAAGLADGGVDVRRADRVVGTSAGSITGAMLMSGDDPATLVASIEEMFSSGTAGSGADEVSPAGLADFMNLMLDGAADAEADRREHLVRVGSFARSAATISEDAFVGTFRSVLGGRSWPRGFACTAVDAETGEFRVWDADSGVALELAVASSCSVPGIYPPITIGDSRYMDGGARSALNADLAGGHDAAIVVSVMVMDLPPGFDDPRISAFLASQRAEVEALRDAGTAVEVIVPDLEFLTISQLGMALMDFSLVAPAAEAGMRLGKAEAERISAVW